MKAHSFMQPYANALISGYTLISGYGQVLSSEYDLTPLLGQDIAIYARGYSVDLAVIIDNLGVPQILRESLAQSHVVGVITVEDSLQKRANSRWVLNDYNAIFTVKEVYTFPFALETSEAIFNWSEPKKHSTKQLEQISNCLVCDGNRFAAGDAIVNRDGFEHKHTCIGSVQVDKDMLKNAAKIFKTLDLADGFTLSSKLDQAIDVAKLSYPKDEREKALFNFKNAFEINQRAKTVYYAANIIALHLFAAYRGFGKSYMQCLELAAKYTAQQTKEEIALPNSTVWKYKP